MHFSMYSCLLLFAISPLSFYRWLIHAILVVLLEKTYAKLTSMQLRRHGKTDATDSGEVHIMNWIFKCRSYDGQKRKRLVWWSILLMGLLALLLPSELVFETGIYERKDCAPTSKMSSGICASPWKGHGNVFVSSTSLLTARANWVDEKWETVLEGSQKSPHVSEVRKMSALKPGRRAVLTACNVTTTACTSSAMCGNLTIWKSAGAYKTIVTSSSLLSAGNRPYCIGDITFDGYLCLGFLFWEGRSQKKSGKRKSLAVKGIETVLDIKETFRVTAEDPKPWNLVTTPARTRLYDISCETDGITERDLAHGLSIYRTMQMELPGVQRVGVKCDLARVLPLEPNDVLRSAYALKSEDGSKACKGEIDIYEPCGDFMVLRALPFLLGTLFISLSWITVLLCVRDGEKVPYDASSWRLLAHNQARVLKHYLENAANKDLAPFSDSGQSVDEERVVYSEYNGPQHVLRYSSKKFQFYLSDPVVVKISLPSTVNMPRNEETASEAEFGPKLSS